MHGGSGAQRDGHLRSTAEMPIWAQTLRPSQEKYKRERIAEDPPLSSSGKGSAVHELGRSGDSEDLVGNEPRCKGLVP